MDGFLKSANSQSCRPNITNCLKADDAADYKCKECKTDFLPFDSDKNCYPKITNCTTLGT